jgi:hypothetical protein
MATDWNEQPLQPKPEIPHGNLILKNLYTLTPHEQQELIDSTSKAHGHCQMWVHTHYCEDRETTDQPTPFDSRGYIEARKRLIESSVNTNKPIIALIETTGYEDLDKKTIEFYQTQYEQLLLPNTDKVIYFVPTFYTNPLPCTSQTSKIWNQKNGNQPDYQTAKIEWKTFTDLLKVIGVEGVIVSGAYYGEILKDGKFITNGCVQKTIDELDSAGLKTFRSKVVLPLGV